ncbi:hypothetical protein Tco_0634706 [Tanacetum coccineum]
MVKYLKNQGNYKISDFKGMSYNEIRPIFEKVWDFNQHIEPMDLEHGSERMKSPEKIKEEDFQEKIFGKDDNLYLQKLTNCGLKTYHFAENFNVLQKSSEEIGSSKKLTDLSEISYSADANLGIAYIWLTEKKYPLDQECIQDLSKRLEVDHESTQAYELLKFIRSQVQK